jgi:hypothetical protein
MTEPRMFEHLSDDDLDDIATACGSAYGEGAFDPESAVADALRAEYIARGRIVPGVYGHPGVPAEQWMSW